MNNGNQKFDRICFDVKFLILKLSVNSIAQGKQWNLIYLVFLKRLIRLKPSMLNVLKINNIILIFLQHGAESQ